MLRIMITIYSRPSRDSDDDDDDDGEGGENGANDLEEEIIEATEFRQSFPQAFGRTFTIKECHSLWCKTLRHQLPSLQDEGGFHFLF